MSCEDLIGNIDKQSTNCLFDNSPIIKNNENLSKIEDLSLSRDSHDLMTMSKSFKKSNKIFICEENQAILNENDNLNGKNYYECKWKNCFKKFSTQGNLKSHMVIHNDSKPFKCDYEGCNKSYSRMCILLTHVRTHIKLRPYNCPYESCMKKFNEKGTLTTHIRTHTGESPFMCTYEGCGKSFKAKGHLNDHLNKHLNLKPYECHICDKKFERASTRKIHLHVHTEEKKYQCKICLKKFKEKGNMKAHEKIHQSKNTPKQEIAENKNDIQISNQTTNLTHPINLNSDSVDLNQIVNHNLISKNNNVLFNNLNAIDPLNYLIPLASQNQVQTNSPYLNSNKNISVDTTIQNLKLMIAYLEIMKTKEFLLNQTNEMMKNFNINQFQTSFDNTILSRFSNNLNLNFSSNTLN